MKPFPLLSPLALLLGLALALPGAASEPTDADLADARRELERARSDLERASSRMAELTQKLYRDEIELALRRPAFERPVIGIVMADDADAGVRLAAVTPQSPAAKAGLRGGDRLLRINGKPLSAGDGEARLAQARELIGELDEGDTVRLAYERDGQAREVTLKAESMPGLVWWRGEGETPEAIRMQLQPLLAERFDMQLGELAPLAGCGRDGKDCLLAPVAEAFRWRGLHLAGVDARLGRYFGTDHGVLVLTTPGDELAGLEPGDVIQRIDGQPVEAPQQAMRLMRGKAPGSQIELQFLRDRKMRELSLDAPKLARFPLLPPPPPAPPAPPVPPTPPAVAAPPAPPAPAAIPGPGRPRGLLPAPPAPRPPAAPPAPPSPQAPPAPPAPPEGDGLVLLERVLL